MVYNMDRRRQQLCELQSFINNADNDFTMILQSLQWDKKGLQNPIRVSCKYDKNHTMHPDKKEQHELGCFLKSEGYCSSDKMLPDPLDSEAKNLVKFCETDINNIIECAAKINPLFNRGCGSVQPLTFERLQATYTADERCAIYDAVLKTLPSCREMPDLQLPGSGEEQGRKKDKSILETQAELRDMKRRRTKYRVAAKTKHYSDVLRQVINTQMELYSEMLSDGNKTQKNRQSNFENRDQKVNEHTSTLNKNEQVSSNELRDSKGDSWRREYHLDDRRHPTDSEDKLEMKYRDKYRSDKYRRDGDSYMGKRDSHMTQSGEKIKRRHGERESHHRKRSPERGEEEKYRRYYDTKSERKQRRYYDNY